MGTAPGFVITAWMYWPAAVLAAVALLVFYLALLHDRARGRKRCPSCWYDMSGTQSLPARCPECGREVTAERELRRTRRRWLLAVLGLAMLAPLGFVFGKLHARAVYYAVMPKWKLSDRFVSGDVVVSLYQVRNPDDFGMRFSVTDRGGKVIAGEDYSITATGYNHAHQPFVDLNGDGVQECIIECYSGGAHCCYFVYIIELRPAGAAVVAHIDAQNGLALVPPTGDAREWLVNIPDQSFAYWKAPYVESPKPSVYYRLQDGSLRVALDKTESDLDAKAASELAGSTLDSARPGDDQVLKPALWGTMLKLIYSGNEPLAWTHFDRNWRGSVEEKEKFRQEFVKVLSGDPWYQDYIAARAAREAGKPIPPSSVGRLRGAGIGAGQ